MIVMCVCVCVCVCICCMSVCLSLCVCVCNYFVHKLMYNVCKIIIECQLLLPATYLVCMLFCTTVLTYITGLNPADGHSIFFPFPIALYTTIGMYKHINT